MHLFPQRTDGVAHDAVAESSSLEEGPQARAEGGIVEAGQTARAPCGNGGGVSTVKGVGAVGGDVPLVGFLLLGPGGCDLNSAWPFSAHDRRPDPAGAGLSPGLG